MIEAVDPPAGSLLSRYQIGGGYVDAYVTLVDRPVDLATWIEAFYTTTPFRCERLLLRLAGLAASSDRQARELGRGARNRFAAWQVEGRRADEILLADIGGRTRSWLKVEDGAAEGSRLWFGSAILPRPESGSGSGSGQPTIGYGFSALLGFHRLYSRVLLGAGAAKVRKGA